jgi:hypothetical protein
MRAVCPSDAGPDIFVDFPAGSTDSDLWRYGCRRAGENDQPTAGDFVATGVVNLGTPNETDLPQPPRFAEPDPPSFVLDAVATTPTVVTAPRFTPQAAAPNPPSWLADLGNVIATTAEAAVAVVRGTPRLASPPVVLDFGPRFTDTGITQTQPDFVPSIFTATAIVAAPSFTPKAAAPNPPSWLADLGNVIATTAAAVVDVVRPAPRMAEPNPPSFGQYPPNIAEIVRDFLPVVPAPEPAPVNRPRPASSRTVCLKLPGGGYVSVPPEYRNGYDGEEVDYAYCLGKTDTETEAPGTGGGSNPVDAPPTDPVVPVLETFIPTGIVQLLTPKQDRLDPFRPDMLMPAKYQDTIFGPTGIVTAPDGDVTAEKPASTGCSCHERSGENRNWLLLLAGAALLYVLTRKSK